MKKIIFTLLLAFVSAFSFSQCPAPTIVSAQAKGSGKFIIKVSNPYPRHYFDVQWSNTGTAPFTLVKCQGVWNDRQGVVDIGIINSASNGYPYYGIQDGATVIIRMHCSPALSTLSQCISDTNLGDPSAPIIVNFH